MRFLRLCVRPNSANYQEVLVSSKSSNSPANPPISASFPRFPPIQKKCATTPPEVVGHDVPVVTACAPSARESKYSPINPCVYPFIHRSNFRPAPVYTPIPPVFVRFANENALFTVFLGPFTGLLPYTKKMCGRRASTFTDVEVLRRTSAFCVSTLYASGAATAVPNSSSACWAVISLNFSRLKGFNFRSTVVPKLPATAIKTVPVGFAAVPPVGRRYRSRRWHNPRQIVV